MPAGEAMGWAAAALMVCTFVCREPRTMRALAVATNLAFIGYGVLAALMPVLALHSLLLPINLWRWSEQVRAAPCGPSRLRPVAERGPAVIVVAALLLFASGDTSVDRIHP